MDEQVKTRLSAFLIQHGTSLDAMPKARVAQLEKADAAIQDRLQKTAELKDLQNASVINIKAIAEATGIARKTFYNNELLRLYVEAYSSGDDDKTSSAAELQRVKSKISQLETQIDCFVDKDVDYENLVLENEKLCREIDNLTGRNQRLEESLSETRKRISELQDIINGKTIVQLPSPDRVPPVRVIQPNMLDFSMTMPENPDDCMLGISFGNLKDYTDSIIVADSVGVNTVMLYCDNSSFLIPSKASLHNYNIVVHGPLNINIGSSDEGMRSYSVKKVLAIIAKLNLIADHIKCLVLHPGSAETDTHLLRSLRELLTAAKFKIAVETMSGRGNELVSSLNEMKTLSLQLQDYNNFAFCLDTCHMHDAGIELSDFEAFIKDLNAYIDITQIACIHVNDSQSDCGVHKDRHANIATGKINLDTLKSFVKAKMFTGIPKILETPQPETGTMYTYEIDELLS